MNPILRLVLACFVVVGVYSASSPTSIQPSGFPNDIQDEDDTRSSKECRSSSNRICIDQKQQSYDSNEIEILMTDAIAPPKATDGTEEAEDCSRPLYRVHSFKKLC